MILYIVFNYFICKYDYIMIKNQFLLIVYLIQFLFKFKL